MDKNSCNNDSLNEGTLMTTDESNDSISYFFDEESGIAHIEIKCVDDFKYHTELISLFSEKVNDNDYINYVRIIIPHQGKTPVKKMVGYKEDINTGQNNVPIYETIYVWNNRFNNCELFGITDRGTVFNKNDINYGNRLVDVNKDDFIGFYTSNMNKILFNIPKKFRASENETDDDGFTLVKNKKKIRNKSYNKLKKSVMNSTKKSLKKAKQILKEIENKNYDELNGE